MGTHTRREFLGAAVTSAAMAASGKIASADGPQFWIAALTMLDRRGRFDDALTKDYLALLAAGGADGVLVLGTTGEFSSFSVKERKQILESHVRHKGKLAIMCQTATPNVPETLELVDHAASAGAGSVLVLPPFYYKNPSLEGLAAFYEPILRASKVPALLYNIPQLSGVAITAELLRRLSPFEKLYGIKDSFSKADAMVAFIKEFPKLKILTGAPGNVAVNLRQGGAGAITGNGSVFLRETTAIFEAFRKGGDPEAAQSRFNDVAKALAGYDGIPAMKYVLGRKGLRESPCRPPFAELPESKKRELDAKFRI
ncbi:MAG: dihydrodipicolinate synthase family protein [Bryobacteraceae bacterium]